MQRLHQSCVVTNVETITIKAIWSLLFNTWNQCRTFWLVATLCLGLGSRQVHASLCRFLSVFYWTVGANHCPVMRQVAYNKRAPVNEQLFILQNKSFCFGNTKKYTNMLLHIMRVLLIANAFARALYWRNANLCPDALAVIVFTYWSKWIH